MILWHASHVLESCNEYIHRVEEICCNYSNESLTNSNISFGNSCKKGSKHNILYTNERFSLQIWAGNITCCQTHHFHMPVFTMYKLTREVCEVHVFDFLRILFDNILIEVTSNLCELGLWLLHLLSWIYWTYIPYQHDKHDEPFQRDITTGYVTAINQYKNVTTRTSGGSRDYHSCDSIIYCWLGWLIKIILVPFCDYYRRHCDVY
jgi:hypothetical protein